MGIEIQNEVKKLFKELVKKGIAEPSNSSWGAPMLVVRKKSGALRVVFDYRALNSITTPHHYPLPSIPELLHKQAMNRVFSALDLKDGFYQLNVEEKSRELAQPSGTDCT